MTSHETESTNVEHEECLPLPDARKLLDMVYVINAIIQSGGHISRAAEELGIGRRTMYDLMERYGVSCGDGKLMVELTPLLRHVELQMPCLEDYR